MVRAKFRCLEITYRLSDATAKLKPVIAKNDDWPNGSQENTAFWDATPSGECEVRFRSHSDVDLEVGAYYYLDLELAAEDDLGGWKLWQVAQCETHVGVNFGLAWDQDRPITSSNLQMDIHNEKAWHHFEGKAGTRWAVAFTKAPGQHDGCPYTG